MEKRTVSTSNRRISSYQAYNGVCVYIYIHHINDNGNALVSLMLCSLKCYYKRINKYDVYLVNVKKKIKKKRHC